MKKVLIISYYWPPAGGISVLRSLKIAKYLRSLGWEIVVYTTKNAQYPIIDEGTFIDIPEGIKVIRKNILEPFNLFKLLTGRKKSYSLNNIVHVKDRTSSVLDKIGIWIRGNFFIPDARSLWIKPSTKFLTDYLKENKVDVIFTDGPPHTNTRIGTLVSQRTGIPHLADFQDPWTQVDYYKELMIGRRANKVHEKMEKETFETAKKVTVVSPSWKKDLEGIGAKNVDVIYWGYDDDDFEGLSQNMEQEFTITHLGLLGIDRMPVSMLKACHQLSDEIPEFKSRLKIRFIGQVDFRVEEEIEKIGLSENVEYTGIISREEALKKGLNSHILLLMLNNAENVKGRIPGKFFEYLRMYRPILCFGPNESDVGDIIMGKAAGEYCQYDDQTKTKNFIERQFTSYLQGDIQNLTRDISEFSIYNQCKKLSSYLNQLVTANNA